MYILAGPNGSGKSSVLMEEIPQGTVILNADIFSREIAKEHGVAYDEIQIMVDNSGVLKLAGMRRLRDHMQQSIDRKETFSTETTLDTKSYINYIKEAKSKGFDVKLLYVGTKSPHINIHRVGDRVIDGGHNVSPGDIVKRYYGSLERLSNYIEMVDIAVIYDNSDIGRSARLILSIKHGKIIQENKPIPDWVNENVIAKLLKNGQREENI
jgi:predicted ABC-type ATPase